MLYLVMGVTGSGKSTVGSALAERLDLPFYDADTFHPPTNREKLRRNEPLGDADRAPWLDRMAAHIPRWVARGGAVLACSALKERYRRVLLDAAPRSRVIFLDVDPAALARRLEERRGSHTLVRDYDQIVAGQFRDLERPEHALTVFAGPPPNEIVDSVVRTLQAEGNIVPRATRLAQGAASAELGREEMVAAVAALVAGLGSVKRILLVPPDHTRGHSAAGELTVMLYERLTKQRCFVEVLPALGTHVPMTSEQLQRMFPGVPDGSFIQHDFQRDLETLGEVPGSFVDDISESRLSYPIRCEVSSKLARGGWDRIISVGQLVPHEVVGIANHNKNIFVGTGGKDIIDKTHFIGAVCDMERIMGRAQSPVREVLNYMSAEFGARLPPITYLLTVRQRVEGRGYRGPDSEAPDEGRGYRGPDSEAPDEGRMVTRGLYAGDDEGCFFAGSKLARSVNIDLLDKPLRKVIVNLDPDEFKSTWIGNKAIYRTRMALADEAELIVLGAGIDKFGEDPAIDRLIRRHGYCGTPRVLEGVAKDPELAASLASAAHLIHGSSEGRFSITYATGNGLSGDEIRSVGYRHESYESATRRYDPQKLRDGINVLPDGEEIFYVSNPALGLWAVR